MRKWCFVVVVALCCSTIFAAEPLVKESGARAKSSPHALAAIIDSQIGEKLKAYSVPAAQRCDDATFFRRINLTLAGRVPVPSEVRLFLADSDRKKREKAVEKLLTSAAYANHMTTTWRNWLLPEAITDSQFANTTQGFDLWLRARIQAGMPIDRLATELLTVPLNGRPAMGRGMDDDPDGTTNPLAFYLAKEGKPANLAAATSRIFMGVQLECAQCHDHPFSRWRRDQFWGLAAFFAGVEMPQNGALREVMDRRELSIPSADRTVPATFLDDKEPEWQFKKSPRVTLAAWLTAKDNPFFARALVNRLWGFVFGLGLVDPIDDFHEQNKPSHPELLDALAKAFVESDFDMKFILRAIVLSDTFQRASVTTDQSQKDARLYSRFPVQGLSPEQLYDSFLVVVGKEQEGTVGAFMQNPASLRRQFLETFALSGRKTENPTTIIQALTLMNGSLVGEATTIESSRTLAAILELPGLSQNERIEAIYIAVLSRLPKPEELRKINNYIETGGSGQTKKRYADVLWALLNGIEFRTNH
jgi:hypothetical protein